MITVKYFVEGCLGGWLYSTKDLRSAVETIKEDMATCSGLALAVVFDEENNKILEVKR